MSSPEISNTPMLSELIRAASATASLDGHRALIVLKAPSDGNLSAFADSYGLTFIGARHAADRADRITEVLGSEFDILIHETHDDVDVGLLAALAGTVKAGGVLVLGLPFSICHNEAGSPTSHFNQRFAHLLADMLPHYPGKVHWLPHLAQVDQISRKSILHRATIAQDALPGLMHSSSIELSSYQAFAHHEQKTLLASACNYLLRHPEGCITITGRRGRGKSALLGQIASWLTEQNITFAMTAARQSALTSVRRHGSGACNFIAPADAYRSGCRVLLVDEASSLPLSLLESFLATHQHVIYCSTIEGYENAGRAFALRFGQRLQQRHAHALSLNPTTPWRWNTGDPLEYFIDSLLPGSNNKAVNEVRPDSAHPLVSNENISTEGADSSLAGCHIHRLDRSELALDEPLLRRVYGLLRDTHYQTSAADLSHMLDAPGLQLWVLDEDAQVRAALMMVLEGGIDPCLHDAIVSKQRRLPHQLLPQLLAQSANQAQALSAVYGRVIRIAVAETDRRRGLGSKLLHAVETATLLPEGLASVVGASFASDAISVAFWHRNGYTRFHTGFRSNPRTGKPAVAVVKNRDPELEPLVQIAVNIHDDNSHSRHNPPDESCNKRLDAELLQRFITGQRSVHDTFAALSRLARQHDLPLRHHPGISRRSYESALREAVKTALAES